MVLRLLSVSFLMAIAIAFLLPTMITFRFALVTAV